MTNLILGDSYLILKTLAADSVDAVVTDPPYGLSFMNKHWDHDVPSVELWREVLRVLKPGGHVLSFGGTRTYHRMVVNIEDAGFEIRDQIQWIYGSGFPKSLDVSKALDKAAGAERQVTREGQTKAHELSGKFDQASSESRERRDIPATDAAKQWQGWGTALKPAFEPIVLARKPLVGTVAENVQTFGTGALNIDASRIGFANGEAGYTYKNGPGGNTFSVGNVVDGTRTQPVEANNLGRWPANVLFDEEAAAALDEQSGILKSGSKKPSMPNGLNNVYGANMGGAAGSIASFGGASRFFKTFKNESEIQCDQTRFLYQAKASKRERGDGNHHPTVKPIKLMEYLVRLITPPGGTVLDPFMGSGTTGIAAKNLGFGFVGIERSEDYFEIAKRRI